MKKRAHSFLVVFSLIMLIFVSLEACSKPAPVQQNTGSISELKKYSLTGGELQGLRLISESNLNKDKLNPNAVSGYTANFSNNAKNATAYRSLSINLQVYNSVDDVKKDFSRNMLPKEVLGTFHEIKIDPAIGDEGFAYSGDVSGQRAVYVLYKLEDAAVQLKSIGIGTNNTIKYARLVESKFKK